MSQILVTYDTKYSVCHDCHVMLQQTTNPFSHTPTALGDTYPHRRVNNETPKRSTSESYESYMQAREERPLLTSCLAATAHFLKSDGIVKGPPQLL